MTGSSWPELRAFFWLLTMVIDHFEQHGWQALPCRRSLVGIVLVLAAPPAIATSGIEEVVLTATRDRHRAQAPALQLDRAGIEERAPRAVSDLLKSISGTYVRVNSRGETVVRIRSAEERQTAVFLDGAPLVTPWDGRVDLSLLPAGIVDQISVTRGAVPMEYGPNAVFGVVDLTTVAHLDATAPRAELQVGSHGIAEASGLFGVSAVGGWSLAGAATLTRRDGERIADRSAVPFDPSRNSERTQTDLDGATVLATGERRSENSVFRTSVLHADVTRGIAAQGHLNPQLSNPRFWRYPRWQLTQLTASLTHAFPGSLRIRGVAWQQWFAQDIDAYQDLSYRALDAREEGDDSTTGARVVVTHDQGSRTLRLSATAQTSTHRQIVLAAGFGERADLVADPTLRYRQELYFAGLEFDRRFGPKITTTVGAGIDRAETPLTGDKPAQGAQHAATYFGGLRWAATDALEVGASLGRRTRFHSPRELFGESLGRFLANPDLDPETATLADITDTWSPGADLALTLGLWSAETHDLIAQRIVKVESARLRQRYNQAGAQTYGLDANLRWRPAPPMTFELGAELHQQFVQREPDGSRPVLLQWPERNLVAAVDWQPTQRVDLRAEVTYVGPAYDLNEDGSLALLPFSTSLNLRAFFEFDSPYKGGSQKLFAAVDNANDELVLPQLGLPAPG